MSKAMRNVLFLCTGNSARSILAEVLMTHAGDGRVRGYSAGSFPKGQVHPVAIEVLAKLGFPTAGLSSKSWDVFAKPGAPRMDYIITVCDQAAGETCPIWPGHPVTAHWGMPDPAAVTGAHAEQLKAFQETARVLRLRIRHFLALPLDEMNPADLKPQLAAVGQLTGEPAS